MRMADLVKAEKLVNDYIGLWEKQGLRSGANIVECNDFGFEHLQLIRNGFQFETLNYDELSRMPALLQRELRGQINYDHKFFWAYCAQITYNLREVKLFSDHEWQSYLSNLVHLLLAGRRRWNMNKGRIHDAESFFEQSKTYEAMMNKCVNSHLLEVESNKWQTSAPMAFALLEGLLRRKNKDFVNLDGTIKNAFEILKNRHEKIVYGNRGKKRLNRIGDSLRCFEQVILSEQGRTTNYLQCFKTEVCTLYSLPPDSDIYELIDKWRNDLLHGEKYWTAKIPTVFNLICLLLIDEVEPEIYDSKREQIQGSIEWRQKTRTFSTPRASWEIYPPDL